jgi:hypothetical protein
MYFIQRNETQVLESEHLYVPIAYGPNSPIIEPSTVGVFSMVLMPHWKLVCDSDVQEIEKASPSAAEAHCFVFIFYFAYIMYANN